MKIISTNLTREEILYTALFGAIWGVSEAALGSLLHAARVPFRGVILSFLAAIILTCSKEFIPYRGSLIFAGAIAATFKVISMQGFALTPVVAIMLESISAETVFMFPWRGILASMAAGSTVLLYTFLHGLISQIVFFGIKILNVYNEFQVNLLGINSSSNAISTVIALLGILHILLGAIAGFLGRKIALQTQLQLSREAT